VLDAYNNAISNTFYLATAISIMAFLTSFGMEWKDVKLKTKAIDPRASGPETAAHIKDGKCT
jgi:hypothetical protein